MLSASFYEPMLCTFSEWCFVRIDMEQPKVKVNQLLSAIAMIGAITYQVFI